MKVFLKMCFGAGAAIVNVNCSIAAVFAAIHYERMCDRLLG